MSRSATASKPQSSKKDFALFSVVKRFGGDKARNMPLCLAVSAVGAALGTLPYFLIWQLMRKLLHNYEQISQSYIVRQALLILLTQVAAAVLNLSASTLSHKLAFRLEKNIRRVQMIHLLNLPAGHFSSVKSGRLRRLVDDNASRTHQLVAHFMPDLAAAVTGPLVLLILILTVDIRFGLITILGLILAFLSLSGMMAQGNKERMGKYFIAGEQLGASGTEFFRGIPVVKVFNQSVHSMRALIKSIEDYSELCLAFSFGSRIPMILYTVSLYLPTLAVLPLAAFLMKDAEDPLMILSSCLFYVVVSQLFNGAFMRLMAVTSATKSYELVGEKIYDVLSLEPLPQLSEAEGKGGLSPEEKAAEICIKNLSYAYPGRDEKALSDINLCFEHGKSYALVGPSGSGKSTLIKLIARYDDPDEGRVYLKGRDIRSMSEDELCQKLSIVFQENRLFKTSFRDNLSMGHEYRDEALQKAMEQANASDILERFEQGLDTMLGTKGTYLSGGEVQRTAIARAFLKPSEILLLDEATASADLQNEAQIYESLERLKSGKTTLMITHRLNNVQKADCIIVLDRGRVVGRGDHETLLASCPTYAELYREYQQALAWRIEKRA